MVIPSTMGICESNPLGRVLFALVHFKALRFIVSHFPSCLFPCVIDDMHIIGPSSIVPFAYEHFQIEFCRISLLSNLKNVQPSSLPPNFDTHPYLTPCQKELGFWGFHWVPHLSHHFLSKMFY
jgi:hypothetical protein